MQPIASKAMELVLPVLDSKPKLSVSTRDNSAARNASWGKLLWCDACAVWVKEEHIKRVHAVKKPTRASTRKAIITNVLSAS